VKKFLIILSVCFFAAQVSIASEYLEPKAAQKNFALWDMMNYDTIKNHNSKKVARDFFDKADKNSNLLKSDVIRDCDKSLGIPESLLINPTEGGMKLVPETDEECNRLPDENKE